MLGSKNVVQDQPLQVGLGLRFLVFGLFSSVVRSVLFTLDAWTLLGSNSHGQLLRSPFLYDVGNHGKLLTLWSLWKDQG
jgi:hypothetical protein